MWARASARAEPAEAGTHTSIMRRSMRRLIASLIILAACATVAPHPPVHVVIVGTTDVHGWFNGHTSNDGTYGGVPLFASYVNALRAENENRVLLVDSGDLFQGTFESNF